jgi:hypothetical protein
MALGFQHPFTCTIAGPSQSGKTEFVKKLLKASSLYITPGPDRIVWAYGIQNEKQFKNISAHCLPKIVEFMEGIPEPGTFNADENNLLIIDDLMGDAGRSKAVADLFTKGCHHRNVSVILILQNLFHQGKVMRDIHTSTNYLVLFKNPRDTTQLYHLQRQCFPNSNNFLLEAYKMATAEPYGYLVIDFRQTTPTQYRVSSNIFPPNDTLVYEPSGHRKV